ncbi:MAG: hypothetical protein ACREXI_00155 [Caldimonas sp.]
MIHPLLHLIATRPELLGEHVEAYAELVGSEVDKTSRLWILRIACYAVAALLLTASVVFTGVALMLWAVVPTADMDMPWLLVAVPLVSLLVGAGCLWRARAAPEHRAFETVKQQLGADLAMLREVSSAA